MMLDQVRVFDSARSVDENGRLRLVAVRAGLRGERAAQGEKTNWLLRQANWE